MLATGGHLFMKHVHLYLMIVLLSLLSLNCVDGVSPEECSGTFGTSNVDPDGANCTKRCECNNQSYEGYCSDGICVAVQRETCDTEGEQRDCQVSSAFSNVTEVKDCQSGTQTCKPEGLDLTKWGDCTCGN